MKTIYVKPQITIAEEAQFALQTFERFHIFMNSENVLIQMAFRIRRCAANAALIRPRNFIVNLFDVSP
jgi:hypothetical protein